MLSLELSLCLITLTLFYPKKSGKDTPNFLISGLYTKKSSICLIHLSYLQGQERKLISSSFTNRIGSIRDRSNSPEPGGYSE